MPETKQYITTAMLMDVVYEDAETGMFTIRPVDLDDLLGSSVTIHLEGNGSEYEPVIYAKWKPFKNARSEIDFRCTACRRFRFHNGEMRSKFLRCPHCGAHMMTCEEG